MLINCVVQAEQVTHSLLTPRCNRKAPLAALNPVSNKIVPRYSRIINLSAYIIGSMSHRD